VSRSDGATASGESNEFPSGAAASLPLLVAASLLMLSLQLCAKAQPATAAGLSILTQALQHTPITTIARK
jgi:hypothetical protein